MQQDTVASGTWGSVARGTCWEEQKLGSLGVRMVSSGHQLGHVITGGLQHGPLSGGDVSSRGEAASRTQQESPQCRVGSSLPPSARATASCLAPPRSCTPQDLRCRRQAPRGHQPYQGTGSLWPCPPLMVSMLLPSMNPAV